MSSIWYGCVLRGDINSIVIGDGTNVQDGTIVHLADDYGVQIGNYTTIGHAAIIHACEIGNECLIGMGFNGAGWSEDRRPLHRGRERPRDAAVCRAARFDDPGRPAKVVRPLTEQEVRSLRPWAEKYVTVANAHALHK
jgi:carbonic anhydrase/acetyltransferase-like protein (isoleucine patch superfamily)